MLAFKFIPSAPAFFESSPMTIYIDGDGNFLFIYNQDKIIAQEHLTAWFNDSMKVLRLFER